MQIVSYYGYSLNERYEISIFIESFFTINLHFACTAFTEVEKREAALFHPFVHELKFSAKLQIILHIAKFSCRISKPSHDGICKGSNYFPNLQEFPVFLLHPSQCDIKIGKVLGLHRCTFAVFSIHFN